MKYTGMIGRATGVVLAATALTVGTASTSSAAAPARTVSASCSTTGASGGMSSTFTPGDFFGEFDVTLSVTDTKADSHHVRVRYLTIPVNSSAVRPWQWHSLKAGKGETLVYPTTAQDSNGIQDMGVEVARFEGDKKLNSCTDWA
ncbi:hypothetical protein ACH49O_17880 [Streptomyces coeruleorubidus]|uniref:hypothetical protein n=1 Tax=Streptomyces coeruleorubidus TaxID=116188 RepID=UPI00340C9DE5